MSRQYVGKYLLSDVNKPMVLFTKLPDVFRLGFFQLLLMFVVALVLIIVRGEFLATHVLLQRWCLRLCRRRSRCEWLAN
jgi:short subunit fatty acids transporter